MSDNIKLTNKETRLLGLLLDVAEGEQPTHPPNAHEMSVLHLIQYGYIAITITEAGKARGEQMAENIAERMEREATDENPA